MSDYYFPPPQIKGLSKFLENYDHVITTKKVSDTSLVKYSKFVYLDFNIKNTTTELLQALWQRKYNKTNIMFNSFTANLSDDFAYIDSQEKLYVVKDWDWYNFDGKLLVKRIKLIPITMEKAKQLTIDYPYDDHYWEKPLYPKIEREGKENE